MLAMYLSIFTAMKSTYLDLSFVNASGTVLLI